MPETQENIDPAALLAWHVAMGADEAIGDEPVDRYKAEAAQAPGAPSPVGQSSAPGHAIAPGQPTTASRPQPNTGPTPVAARPALPTSGAGTQAAEDAASACNTIEELKAALEGFDGGLLKRSAKNTVFADGVPGSPLMVIGDVPGSEDDQNGMPFSGPAGHLLNKMLAAIDLNRSENAYLSVVVPWRPLGNSKPDAALLSICKPFLARHIELAAPKVILGLGGTLGKTLFETQDSISRQRGRWQEFNGDNQKIALIATYHPTYLLNQPHQKGNAWRDLLAVKEKLAS